MSQIKKPNDRKAMMLTERTARLCHSANRAYCDIIGDPVAPAWDDLDKDVRHGVMSAVRFIQDCNLDVSPEYLHERWMNDRKKNGWVFGAKLGRKAKTHPNLIAFRELPESQRIKDILFLNIVKAMTPSV